jgi:hypothetical protein
MIRQLYTKKHVTSFAPVAGHCVVMSSNFSGTVQFGGASSYTVINSLVACPPGPSQSMTQDACYALHVSAPLRRTATAPPPPPPHNTKLTMATS